MAASDATKLVIRIAGNIDDLKRAMAEGRLVIDDVSTKLGRMTSNFRGDKIIADMKQMAQAVKDAGGAAVLTEKNQARVNAKVVEAIDQYRRLGQTAPADMLALERATRGVDEASTRGALSFGSMAGAVATGIAAFHLLARAGREVWEFLKSSVEAAEEADSALSRLTTAMKAQGNAAPALVDGYRKMSAEFQHTTTYSHDAIEEVMGTLIQLGNVAPENMRKALEATTNLAAGLGRDLEPVAQAVGKALGGNTTALSKLIPEIKSAGAEAKTATGLLRILSESGFGGQAAAAATTYAGRIKQIGNEWTDFKETIGDAIVRNQTVREAMSLVTDALIAQTGHLSQNRVGFELVSGAVILLIRGLAAVVSVAGSVMSIWTSLKVLFGNVAQVVMGAAFAFEETALGIAHVLHFSSFGKAFGDDVARLTENTTRLGAKMMNLGASLQTSSADVEGFKAKANGMAATMNAAADSLEKTRGKEAEVVTGMVAHRAAIEGLDKASGDLKKKIDAAYDAASDQDAIDGFRVLDEVLRRLIENRYRPSGDFLEKYRKQAIEASYALNLMGKSAEAARVANLGLATLLESHPLVVNYAAAPELPLATLKAYPLPSTFAPTPTIEGFKGLTKASIEWGEAVGKAGELFGQTFQNINSKIGQTAQILGNGFAAIKKAGISSAEGVAAAFTMAAGIVSELFGTGSKAGAGAVGALAGAGAGAMIGSVIPGVGTAIGAAVGAIAGAFMGWLSAAKKLREANAAATAQVREYEADLLKTYGTLQNVAALGDVLGVDLAGAWGDQSQEGLKHFKALLDEFNEKMKTLQSALDEYGFTWLDLNDDLKTFSLNQSADKLIEDFRRMTSAGIAPDKAIKGMSASLSQLVVDAVRSGQKIPAALQPILRSLIEMGGLTDEAGRAMLGLGVDTMPALADIEAAAGRYGLTLDQLGPKVKQLQINDVAKQVVADWDLLKLAGADVGTVMAGMKDKVQGLVTDALKLGLELPSSMKPLIENMIKAGLLTDENGDKLMEVGKLPFALDLAKSFDTLIEKLDKLIDKLTGPGGVADSITGLPDKTVTVTAVYDHGANPQYDPGANPQYQAEGGMVPQYLTGGGRLLSFRPRGSDTVPAMLTPGEIVLNQAQQKNVAAGLQSDRPVVINHYEIKAIDSQDVKRFFEKGGVRAFSEAVQVDAGHQNDYAGKVIRKLVNG